MLKSQERDYSRSIIDLKSEIEAQKKKSEHLENTLISRTNSSNELESQSDEELQLLKFHNYKYKEKLKALEAELQEIKNSKVRPTLAECSCR